MIAVGGPDLGFTGGGFDLVTVVVAALLLLVARTVAGLRIGLPTIIAASLAAPLLEVMARRIGYPTVAATVLVIAVGIGRMRRRRPRTT